MTELKKFPVNSVSLHDSLSMGGTQGSAMKLGDIEKVTKIMPKGSKELVISRLIQYVLKSDSYRKLKKSFRQVEGYTDYDNIAVRMAMQICCLELVGEDLSQERFYDMCENNSILTQLIIDVKLLTMNTFPVYWITRELAEDFIKTDIPKHVGHINKVLDYFLLMIPKGLIVLDDEKQDMVDFVIIRHIDGGKGEYELDFKDNSLRIIKDLKHEKLSFAACSTIGYVYSCVFELRNDSEEQFRFGEFVVDKINEELDLDKEKEIYERLKRIVILTLLYLQRIPEEETVQEIEVEAKGVGFDTKKSKRQKKEYLNPIWIGKNYKPTIRKATKKEEEEIRKYQIHTHQFVRRGHLRRVVVGKKEEGLREWRWIPPVTIIR